MNILMYIYTLYINTYMYIYNPKKKNPQLFPMPSPSIYLQKLSQISETPARKGQQPFKSWTKISQITVSIFIGRSSESHVRD